MKNSGSEKKNSYLHRIAGWSFLKLCHVTLGTCALCYEQKRSCEESDFGKTAKSPANLAEELQKARTPPRAGKDTQICSWQFFQKLR